MMPHYYNYELMKHINGDTQMTDVWRLPAIAPWEKICSKHPTQKPLGLLSRIILASTEPSAWILDPFAGSSTTGIAANLLGRRFLGIEREEKFAAISKARREEIENVQTFATYRRKIPDIVKAENNQLELSMCCESEGIDSLPFLSDEIPKKYILMYAVNTQIRKNTEHVGKLALGMNRVDMSGYNLEDIGYIMFHYWNNATATPYELTKTPVIVDRDDVPNGFAMRMNKEAEKYILLEYNPAVPADLGNFDTLKVQRHKEKRYLPFMTQIS